MYEMRHENINPFLGCLADPSQPALVWEMCTRGSLNSVLASEDIRLDWTFRLSLLNDLVKVCNHPVYMKRAIVTTQPKKRRLSQ
ncbi:hypothetical protein HPB49_025688 [Dermacentor silvarum]|nr:hypothetical protein HPB49_025688 [Dermacentor silvarum]